jgi:hypothetical protein
MCNLLRKPRFVWEPPNNGFFRRLAMLCLLSLLTAVAWGAPHARTRVQTVWGLAFTVRSFVLCHFATFF